MMGIDEAEKLLNTGEIFSSYFCPNVDFITTSTIHDQPLGELRWTQEANIVSTLRPQYHIPTDYWVYGDMDPQDRKSNIEDMMDGTKWLTHQLTDKETTVIPLMSGVTREERNICYRTFEELGISYAAIYGAQYFGGSMGNGINKLNNYIREIVSEYEFDGLLLIGLQSAAYLQRLPPEVVAAAGLRWISQSNLRNSPIEQSVTRFGQWKQKPEAQLGNGTTTLSAFSPAAQEVTA